MTGERPADRRTTSFSDPRAVERYLEGPVRMVPGLVDMHRMAAMLLAVMFLAFMAQIVFRYLFNFPIGWTSELTVITWLWLVLWGAAFVVTEAEEIRFDLIYGGVGPRTRRIMAIVTAISLLVLYGMSLPAVWAGWRV